MIVDAKTRIEQIRQARRIHGGTMNLCVAAAGVKLSRVPIPSQRLRTRLFRSIYGGKYAALAEDELERPLTDYRSLNDVFTRGVRPEYRPYPDGDCHVLCPCDGQVQEVGDVQPDTTFFVKQISYSLTSLLPTTETSPFRGGKFAVFFLSPADCHRVFAPTRGSLQKITHIPGRRLLVHPPFQRPEYPVFALNERVVMEFETSLGRCVLVMVAGWGVGNITYTFPNDLRPSRRRISVCRCADPPEFARGQWLATFELGSTVILILEPHPDLATDLRCGSSIKYGEIAFTRAEKGGE